MRAQVRRFAGYAQACGQGEGDRRRNDAMDSHMLIERYVQQAGQSEPVTVADSPIPIVTTKHQIVARNRRSF